MSSPVTITQVVQEIGARIAVPITVTQVVLEVGATIPVPMTITQIVVEVGAALGVTPPPPVSGGQPVLMCVG